MNQTNAPIFRKKAVETYIHEQERSVLLHFISPRRFFFLWIIFGLLSGLGVWLCFAQVPIYASGKGIIVDCNERDDSPHQKPCVVALFPADLHSRLMVGKNLMIKPNRKRQWLHLSIVKVESKVLNPVEVQNRYHAKSGGIPIPNQPAAVALCQLDGKPYPTRSDLHVDGTIEVRINAGTRRLASFLPLLGGFFKK